MNCSADECGVEDTNPLVKWLIHASEMDSWNKSVKDAKRLDGYAVIPYEGKFPPIPIPRIPRWSPSWD